MIIFSSDSFLERSEAKKYQVLYKFDPQKERIYDAQSVSKYVNVLFTAHKKQIFFFHFNSMYTLYINAHSLFKSIYIYFSEGKTTNKFP